MSFVFPSLFWQNNQVLGIGSGSTIVHAVQRIGTSSFLDCAGVSCVFMGVGGGGRREGWAQVWLCLSPHSAL